MINLLPDKNRFIVRREFLRRAMVLFGVGISFLIAVQLFFSSLSLFFLDSFLESFESQNTYMEKLTQRENLEQYEAQVSDLNKALSLLKNIGTTPPIITESIWKVLSAKPAGVDVSSFIFQKSLQEGEGFSLRFAGHSGARDDLVSFVDNLKKSKDFPDVESPLSNLLTEKDIDYTLIVSINNF